MSRAAYGDVSDCLLPLSSAFVLCLCPLPLFSASYTRPLPPSSASILCTPTPTPTPTPVATGMHLRHKASTHDAEPGTMATSRPPIQRRRTAHARPQQQQQQQQQRLAPRDPPSISAIAPPAASTWTLVPWQTSAHVLPPRRPSLLLAQHRAALSNAVAVAVAVAAFPFAAVASLGLARFGGVVLRVGSLFSSANIAQHCPNPSPPFPHTAIGSTRIDIQPLRVLGLARIRRRCAPWQLRESFVAASHYNSQHPKPSQHPDFGPRRNSTCISICISPPRQSRVWAWRNSAALCSVAVAESLQHPHHINQHQSCRNVPPRRHPHMKFNMHIEIHAPSHKAKFGAMFPTLWGCRRAPASSLQHPTTTPNTKAVTASHDDDIPT
ncbi:hypothetical protein K505DRAFT_368719 [Melanomma pulvis-pyrius CBS 109.77]|uniref:Uncharacterized protein n=1 Tax=Melanomma pulvis-pyrius CBS 109.77 TaxID=1314802 RepID=A0A6A6WP68_9PLEO|nr:hypothetical protein K505DRAFT_368719 [Melanomma pulvis-pyrius CBS 109.77]